MGPLGIGTKFDHFQSAGSLPELIERLKMDATEGATSSARLDNIQAVMPSGPGAV